MPQQAPSSDDKPANPRRIAAVTTGRADYGILTPVLRALDARPDTAPVIYATGAHLSQRLGRTIDTIRADGWTEIQEIPSEAGDRDLPTAAKLARATAGFADAFTNHRPDLCLLLGDRFETLAAATAAAASGVPIAHIHGGEVTLGALDNQFRYAISALANLHCTATDLSRRRLIAMSEPDHTVIHTGAPGLDPLADFKPMPHDAFCQQAGLPNDAPFLLVTLHPTTIADSDPAEHARQLIEALDTTAMPCLVTAANQDAAGQTINAALTDACASRNWPFAKALGPDLYRNAMHHAAAMVGNSSSGIIEAASLNLPVVNIGDRQLGRERSGNVIDCDHDAQHITGAIRRALTLDRTTFTNIYGPPDGETQAAPRIAEAVATMPLGPAALRKPFAPPSLELLPPPS